MSSLMVQLLFSLLIIVFTIAMMIFMYRYARRKMHEDSTQRVAQKPAANK